MKLLVITQEMDKEGDVLGFFVDWMRELSKYFEKVEIAHLRGVGAKMPKNVTLHKLSGNKAKKVIMLNELISKTRPDRILVHMCPEFVISIYPNTVLHRIPIIMFYAHGGTSPKVTLAEKMCRKILTTTESGFRIKSKKKVVIHQGIDSEKFYWSEGRYLLDVARISKVKKHDLIISAFSVISKRRPGLKLKIVGDDPSEKKETVGGLKKVVRELGLEGMVELAGKIPNKEMPAVYAECAVFVSASETGSLDKTGLEAMASGKPVLVCNEAFDKILSGFEEECMFEKGNSGELAKKMEWFLDNHKKAKDIGAILKKRVKEQHSMQDLMRRIAEEIKLEK